MEAAVFCVAFFRVTLTWLFSAPLMAENDSIWEKVNEYLFTINLTTLRQIKNPVAIFLPRHVKHSDELMMKY